MGRIARLANKERNHKLWMQHIFLSVKHPAFFQGCEDTCRKMLDNMMTGLLMKRPYVKFKIMSPQKVIFSLIGTFINDYLNTQSGKK